MKRRMIDGGIWANEKFAEMPPMARLLQIGLINLADDQGRVKAHPAYLRSQLFPYDDVSLEEINGWLQTIVANGTAIIYEVDGKEYLQLINWWEYQSLQYASPSEYPRPEGWQDRIRYNAKGHLTLTCNWTTVSGEKLEDLCDQNGDPLPIVATLPPRNPGGRPPKNPGGNLPGNPGGKPGGNINNDQIKNNINKGRDHAGADENVAESPIPTPSPPVLIFQEFSTKPINRAHTQAITSVITDLDLWRHVLTEWSLRGYNMGNVNGLLDWYRDGIPPVSRNGTHGTHTKHSESNGGDNPPKLDPELQRQFAERAERKRSQAP